MNLKRRRAAPGQPDGPWDSTIRGTETIDDLRAKLLHKPIQLPKRVKIKVHGTLFPCALLSSGWWEKQKSAKVQHMKWRDGLQEWLFTGFDQWGHLGTSRGTSITGQRAVSSPSSATATKQIRSRCLRCPKTPQISAWVPRRGHPGICGGERLRHAARQDRRGNLRPFCGIICNN